MEKNNFTPEESLTIITKAIANLKLNYKESARVYLLWGWVLTLASFSSFIILKVLHSNQAYERMGLFSIGNWAVFILIGFILMFFMERKTDRNKKVYSHLERFVKNLWTVTAAAFFIATFLCIQLEINPPPIMLLIAGIAATTSGLLIKFRPVILGGLAFFLFSIAGAFINNEYISLLTAAAIICGYLIPGYLLRSAKE
jgi:hypothetical protein